MNHPLPDYIIAGKFLLPNSEQESTIENGAVAVAGDTILDIGTGATLEKRYPQTPIIREKHGLIMPGLINCHTHSPMACFRGIADDIPLMEWLKDHIFPLEAQLTPNMVQLSATLSIAEMIRSGTTSFCDMYLFSKEIADAAHASGIRAWIGEVFNDFPSPCYGSVDQGIDYIQNLQAQYTNNPLITVTVAPHSAYTCSPSLLVRLGEFANDTDSLFVIHLAENDQEMEICRQRFSLSPVNHLANLGLLSRRMLACHCVKINSEEIDLLQKNEVKIAHCIESNMKLGSGIAPVVEMVKQGITLALGTDGSASNNDVDMFGEMNSVAKMHKIACQDPTVMGAEQTLFAATEAGAKALMAEEKIGALRPGMQADFIVLNTDQPHMTPLYNLPSHLSYVARGGDVMHSFVAGRQLMKNRKLITIDEDRLTHNMGKLAEHILKMSRL